MCFVPLIPQQIANTNIFLFIKEHDTLFIHLYLHLSYRTSMNK